MPINFSLLIILFLLTITASVIFLLQGIISMVHIEQDSNDTYHNNLKEQIKAIDENLISLEEEKKLNKILEQDFILLQNKILLSKQKLVNKIQ